jgi:hypothetical protein
MATITRPDENIATPNIGIDYSTARLAGRGLIGVGSALEGASRVIGDSAARTMNESLRVSNTIDAEGQRLFEASKKSHQSAVLLNKITEATQKFLVSQNNRVQQTTDEEGNPVFTNLHTDIGNIGADILKEVQGTIIDPEVAREFGANFGQFVSHQKISALKKGLSQQVKFGEDALNNGLKSLIEQATSDEPVQVGTYQAQGLEAINNALSGGIISTDQFQKMNGEFSENIKSSVIENQISNDPLTAGNILSQPSESLGISPQLHTDLKTQLRTKIQSDDIEYSKARLMQDTDRLTGQAVLTESVRSLIDAGAIRGDDILKLKGKMSKKQFNSIKTMYINSVKKQEREQANLNEIAQRITTNTGVDELSGSTLNKFYDYMVKQRSDITRKAVSLQEEAQIATIIPAPVGRFTEKLETNFIHGNPQSAEDMLSAYTYIKDRQSPALDKGFSGKSLAIAEQMNVLVAKGGMAPQEALTKAREYVLNAKEDVRKERLGQFSKALDFKPGTLEETAASNLPGAELFFGENIISDEAKYTFKEFARQGFLETGTKDGAIGYATEMMKKNYGTSDISGSKQFTRKPIEKRYRNIPVSELREALIEDNKAFLPEGADINSLSLVADDFTGERIRITKDGQEKVEPTWMVVTSKKYGDTTIDVPVNDPMTGKPKRWGPSISSYIKGAKERERLEQAQKLTDIKKANEEFRGQGGNRVHPVLKNLRDIFEPISNYVNEK